MSWVICEVIQALNDELGMQLKAIPTECKFSLLLPLLPAVGTSPFANNTIIIYTHSLAANYDNNIYYITLPVAVVRSTLPLIL